MENPNEVLSAAEEHQLISSDESIPLNGFRKYQGVWLAEFFLPGVINAQRDFKARPTDILLATYPKCGTTWLKALAFSIATRARLSFTGHPLHDLSPHACIPLLEEECLNFDGISKLDVMNNEEPRLLQTHMPFSLLPESIKTSNCRLVSIYRDPKDALISFWYFRNKIWGSCGGTYTVVPFAVFFEMFYQGIIGFGSIWEHALGYWNESLRAPGRILFLKYEELLEAPVENLTKLAEFMGCPFTVEEVKRGVPEEISSLCNFNKLSDAAAKQDRATGVAGTIGLKPEAYFRKGVAGDWKNHLSSEMAQKLDQMTEEKLQGTGLVIRHPDHEATKIYGRMHGR
ncbi:flavonol sulfotransferase-like [Canna indica]|uniref:Sulfotransferase n=1 Tax=Canna indica TaxID=4628 RepID=A0AAQ3QM38_9LILI|nr:flavonol sulfotransferase-like [Canna indica]